MGFKLKQKYEVFKVVDGPFAGHTYRHDVVYDDVPPQEKHKFDEENVERLKGLKVQKSKKETSSTLEPFDSSTKEVKGGE